MTWHASDSRQNGGDSCRPIFQIADAIILAAYMQLKSFVVCNFTFTMPTKMLVYENFGYHLNHTWTPLATCVHFAHSILIRKLFISRSTNIFCFLFGLCFIQPLTGVLPYKDSSAFVFYFEINRKRGGLLVAWWGSAVRWLPDNFFSPRWPPAPFMFWSQSTELAEEVLKNSKQPLQMHKFAIFTQMYLKMLKLSVSYLD